MGSRTMRKSIFTLTVVGSAISACTENPSATSYVPVAAPKAAAAPKVDVFQGAAVDAPIAGLPGAVWADPNNTGYVTGYTYNGQYHAGAPPGYDPMRHAVTPPH